jgi:hypothetical protein
MKRPTRLLLAFLFFTVAFAQIEEPIQKSLASPQALLGLMQGATDVIFLVTPLQSPALDGELTNAAGRGVKVYLITTAESTAQHLIGRGVSVKTLPSLSEGMALIDDTLIIGGLLGGTNQEAQTLDTTAFGPTVLEQLRVLWQVAQ